MVTPKKGDPSVRITLDLRRSEYNDLIMLQEIRGARSKAQVLRDLIREAIQGARK